MPDESRAAATGTGHTPEEIRGWRHARLVAAWDPAGRHITRVGFASLNQADLWGRDAVAVCRRNPVSHRAPEPGCKCGFYSKTSREEIMRGEYPGQLARDRTIVLCRVRLSGDVIEGETGWRASHQRVEQVIVDEECAGCGAESSWLGVNPDITGGLFITGDGAWVGLSAYCEGCAPELRVTFEEAAAELGTPVVRGQVRDAAAQEEANPFAGSHWQAPKATTHEEARAQRIRRGVGTFIITWMTAAAAAAAIWATRAGVGAEWWVRGGRPVGAGLAGAHLLFWLMAILWAVCAVGSYESSRRGRVCQLAPPDSWTARLWPGRLRLSPPTPEQYRHQWAAAVSALFSAVSLWLAGGVGMAMIAAGAAAGIWVTQKTTRSNIFWALTLVAFIGGAYQHVGVPHVWGLTQHEDGAVRVEVLREESFAASAVGAVKPGHYITEGDIQLLAPDPKLATYWGLEDHTCVAVRAADEEAGHTYQAGPENIVAAWQTDDKLCRRDELAQHIEGIETEIEGIETEIEGIETEGADDA